MITTSATVVMLLPLFVLRETMLIKSLKWIIIHDKPTNFAWMLWLKLSTNYSCYLTCYGCTRCKRNFMLHIIKGKYYYDYPMRNNLFFFVFNLICFNSVSQATRVCAVYHHFHHVLCFGSMADYRLGVKLQ